jgi:hypothetical protein
VPRWDEQIGASGCKEQMLPTAVAKSGPPPRTVEKASHYSALRRNRPLPLDKPFLESNTRETVSIINRESEGVNEYSEFCGYQPNLGAIFSWKAKNAVKEVSFVLEKTKNRSGIPFPYSQTMIKLSDVTVSIVVSSIRCGHAFDSRSR